MLAYILDDPLFHNALLAAGALGVACAVLSVFVIARRWAFIGEGISHSGFGGAGSAWLLALMFPLFDQPWAPYAGVVLFCLGTALAIGWVSRGGRINSDAAIGVFLVGSLAWGFLAQQVYHHYRMVSPTGFENILFGGHIQIISLQYAIASVMVCGAVLLTVMMLGKEILSYCFDPVMAEVSGVRARFIHYLLMVLIAATIIIGVRIAGSVLVTALLILPGVTATVLSSRLRTVFVIAIVVGLIGAVGGLLVNVQWRMVPAGPAIVLVLFIQFLLAYAVAKFGPVPRTAPGQPAA